MKKVTIIGCGWLGLALGKTLNANGFSVAGSVRRKEQLKILSNAKIDGFLLDLESEVAVPEAHRTSSDILLIAVPPFDRQNPGHYGQALGKLIAQFSGVQHLIFVSSTGIYPHRSGEYPEDFSFLEGEKKANVLYIAEQEVFRSNALVKTILRPSGLFGPGRHPALHLAGRKNVSDPSGHVNLVHQGDVIRAILLCIERGSKAAGIFNLAYPDHPWRKVYYTKIYRQYDLNAIGFETSSSIDRMIPGDKISKTLGFSYEHPIDQLDDVLANNL